MTPVDVKNTTKIAVLRNGTVLSFPEIAVFQALGYTTVQSIVTKRGEPKKKVYMHVYVTSNPRRILFMPFVLTEKRYHDDIPMWKSNARSKRLCINVAKLWQSLQINPTGLPSQLPYEVTNQCISIRL